jgi:hypothetical protein
VFSFVVAGWSAGSVSVTNGQTPDGQRGVKKVGCPSAAALFV